MQLGSPYPGLIIWFSPRNIYIHIKHQSGAPGLVLRKPVSQPASMCQVESVQYVKQLVCLHITRRQVFPGCWMPSPAADTPRLSSLCEAHHCVLAIITQAFITRRSTFTLAVIQTAITLMIQFAWIDRRTFVRFKLLQSAQYNNCNTHEDRLEGTPFVNMSIFREL